MITVRATQRFWDWLGRLRDETARARIVRRIDRLRFGNLGDAKSIGGGVSELRVDHGPGYRLYFVRRGSEVVVLLCGGDKSSQARDISLARELAERED